MPLARISTEDIPSKINLVKVKLVANNYWERSSLFFGHGGDGNFGLVAMFNKVYKNYRQNKKSNYHTQQRPEPSNHLAIQQLTNQSTRQTKIFLVKKISNLR